MRWFKLAVVLVTLLLIAAFGVQNSSRSTQLSFDLGVSAWKLTEPASVPVVMGLCFGGGAVLAAATGLRKRLSLGRRVRQLEQELALRGVAREEKDDAKGGWG